MADPDTTVFLSYRRDVSGPMAHLVRNDLVAHGFDVFMDVASIGSGEFERVILREIEARTHFLVLLEPGSLDRIAEPGDWLRREIAHALTHRRNVVPLLAAAPACRAPRTCPPTSRGLPSLNAVSRTARLLRRGDGEAARPVPAPARPGATPPAAGDRRRTGRSPVRWAGRTPPRSAARSSGPLARSGARCRRRPVVRRGRGAPLRHRAVVDRRLRPRAVVHLRGAPPRRRAPLELDRGRFFRVRAVAREGFDRGPWSDVVEVR